MMDAGGPDLTLRLQPGATRRASTPMLESDQPAAPSADETTIEQRRVGALLRPNVDVDRAGSEPVWQSVEHQGH
jgi:hypothetical protein